MQTEICNRGKIFELHYLQLQLCTETVNFSGNFHPLSVTAYPFQGQGGAGVVSVDIA